MRPGTKGRQAQLFPWLGRASYRCGTRAEAGKPNAAHAQWHRRHPELGPPCGAALEERLLYDRRLTGRPALKRYDHGCGGRADAGEASYAHYYWHWQLDTLPCGRALEEARLYRVGWHGGQVKRGKAFWKAATAVYRITFADGDIYTGIGKNPERRWREHARADNEVGEKMRAVLWWPEVLYVAPNRWWAQCVERGVIRAGNPFGRVLNIHHSEAAVEGG